MISVAKPKMFNYKNFIKTLLIVFLYVFVLRFYSAPVNFDFIYQINIRFVFSQIMDMLTFSLLINLTLIAHAICFLTDLLLGAANIGIYNYLACDLIKISQIKRMFKSEFDVLDASNPFLYSNKTCALLE